MAESVGLSHFRGVGILHAKLTQDDLSLGFRDIKRLLISEGLREIAYLNTGDQLAYLLEERRYLQREVLDLSTRTVSCSRSVADIQDMLERQKDDYESELHDQHVAMQEVKETLERVHQSEINTLQNEKKMMETELGNAQDTIQELQLILDKLQLDGKVTVEAKCKCKEKLKSAEHHRDSLQVQLNEQQRLVFQLKDKILVLEKLNKQIELDNETLSYKLSEVLAQYDDLEDQLQKEKRNSRKNSISRTSTSDSPSRINNLHSLLDNKISTAHHELSLVSQIKKLQFQVSKLQEDIIASNKKNEVLMLKYQQRKIRHKERLTKIRSDMDQQFRDWQSRLSAMSHSKELAEEALAKESDWRAKVENDCTKLLNEKRHLLLRLVESEDQKSTQENEYDLV